MKVRTNELHLALKACLSTMLSDENRPHLNAIEFRLENEELTLVSSDGHRLSIARVNTVEPGLWKNGCVRGPEAQRLELNLRKLKPQDVEVYWSDEGLTIGRFGTFLRESAKFPPYERVVPKRVASLNGPALPMALKTKYIIDALQQFKLCIGKETPVVFQPLKSATDPIRMDSEWGDIGLTVVVMPMRVEFDEDPA